MSHHCPANSFFSFLSIASFLATAMLLIAPSRTPEFSLSPLTSRLSIDLQLILPISELGFLLLQPANLRLLPSKYIVIWLNIISNQIKNGFQILTSVFQLVNEVTTIKIKVCKQIPPIIPPHIPCNQHGEFWSLKSLDSLINYDQEKNQ